MRKKNWLVMAGLVVLATNIRAQLPIDGVHYPVGLEGIKGGSLPKPGIYFRDDNLFYTGTSDALPDFNTFVYLQAPRLTWMTGWKILGAAYGMDVMVPIVYKQTSHETSSISTPGGGYSLPTKQEASRFGLGNIEIEPLLLSWHLKHFDFMTGYALWLPTSDYDKTSLVNLGNDQWTHMISLGGVWHPDKEKTWAVSVLNHFEFNSEQIGSRVNTIPGGGYSVTTLVDVPCSVFTLEWGISKTICEETDLGISGYYQHLFTDQTDATVIFRDSSVVGIGPELRTQISRWDLSASLRYAYEFLADNRPQGHSLNLTLTKRF
jgi:hypothetical protein